MAVAHSEVSGAEDDCLPIATSECDDADHEAGMRGRRSRTSERMDEAEEHCVLIDY